MVRTVKSHHEEEEEEDEDDEFVSRTTDGSSHRVKVDGKSGDQKVNALRSKHSETEQRRRSKINERFQILRDLIPQNDQKRDKASLLLEVIQYIQFLQDKLQMYEGTYQGWSSEPSKLIPWRNNCGPVESFIDQPQLVKIDTGHEDNIDVTPVLLVNAQNSVESDLSGASMYEARDHAPGVATKAISLDMPLQQSLFEGVPAQPSRGSISDVGHLASPSQSQFWQGRPCTIECDVPSFTLNGQEQPRIESREASISNAYSQGLLNTLSHALQSSGVDLSRASISVQLDIGKRNNSGVTSTTFSDHRSQSPANEAVAHYGVGSSSEETDQAHKRLRAEQS